MLNEEVDTPRRPALFLQDSAVRQEAERRNIDYGGAEMRLHSHGHFLPSGDSVARPI